MHAGQMLRVAGLGLILAPAFLLAALAAEADKMPAGNELSAGRLVQSALKAETLGDNASREVLLRGAIERDAEYAPARWHAGQVRVGDRWLPLEEAESAAAASPELAEYRRLRQEKTGTPEGELALARWCDEHGLADRASVHWMNVLRFDPQHNEALRKLDLRWYRGQLMTRDEIEQGQHASSKPQPQEDSPPSAEIPRFPHSNRTAQQEQWRRAVNGWVRAQERGEPGVETAVREAVLAIGQASELQALDETIRERSSRGENSEALKRLSLALLQAAQDHATLSPLPLLMVNAVDHPDADVRAAAADGLKKFPRDQYVPVLIAEMDTPVEAHYSVSVYPYGGVVSQISFYKRGPEGDYRVVQNESLYRAGDPVLPEYAVRPGDQQGLEFARERARAGAIEGPMRAAAEAQAAASSAAARGHIIAAEAEVRNAAVRERNARIREILRRATETDQGEDPIAWYDWWTDSLYHYYEYERPEQTERPIYETRSYVPRRVYSPYRYAGPLGGVRTGSCFPPGTTVWTETGSTAIETVVPGDRVLSQNPVTGELGFQEVLETTRRNPCPLIRIGLGDEEILCTRGHPFWVLGEGWRMAKQLQPGMRLHSTAGAVLVDCVEEIAAVEPTTPLNHNLVVAGFGTYFVGQKRLLVHDNRLFQHTTLAVPGLEE